MGKILLKLFIGLSILGAAVGTIVLVGAYLWFSKGLPDVSKLDEYNPNEVTKVLDRNGEQIGEFFNVERRTLVSEEDIPDYLEQAFMSAEDSDFYSHSGINYQAIMRAAIKNFMAGRTVQGGSTITQQVVKQIFLTDERSYERKIKEAILAKRLERKYSKDLILNLYLNHIYLGEGAYGVEMASQTYFNKSAKDITVKEAAVLAGLTSRPSKNSPLKNPKAAKRRQRYVLFRMAEEGYITREEAEIAVNENLTVFFKQKIERTAPYFVEVVRQVLSDEIGDDALLQDGLIIKTSLDLKKQQAAQKAMKKGLRELDKRQGFRGPKANYKTQEETEAFLSKSRDTFIKTFYKKIEIDPEGEITGPIKEPLNLTVFNTSSEENKAELKPNLPDYIQTNDIVDAIVTKVSNRSGLTFVRFGEHRGVITFDSMKWARKPDSDAHWRYTHLKKPSHALKRGDVIQVKIISDKIDDPKILKTKLVDHITSHALVELEQEPIAQGALLALDQKTSEIITMVGGYDFEKSKYNRTYQALRQTGSAFKPIVYASALDYGFTPTTEILDIPRVFEEEVPPEEGSDEVIIRKYKPSNHSGDFSGDVIFRDALVRSLNAPTIEVITKISVPWALNYARRLGAFSPLNNDLTAALGSSGLTLYEMTKIYAHLGRLGKEMSPILIHSVEDQEGNALLTDYKFDKRFEEKMNSAKETFMQMTFEDMKFGDMKEVFPLEKPGQLITPQTAYITTNILSDVIYGSRGTAARARALNRPAAGKTGTTNAYYDAWFMGYTPQIVTGVWVGFDNERSLGRGEVGGSAALPIWTDYMLKAHKGLPKEDFEVPPGIVFSNIDADTGKLANAKTERVAKQAFRENFEPSEMDSSSKDVDAKDLFMEDLDE